MRETCTDNRYEIIEKAKKDILELTNVNTSPEEMKVLDNILFRCWQMGWLDKYNHNVDGIYAEFFAVKNGKRYNVKIVNFKDMVKGLTDGIVNSIENMIGL